MIKKTDKRNSSSSKVSDSKTKMNQSKTKMGESKTKMNESKTKMNESKTNMGKSKTKLDSKNVTKNSLMTNKKGGENSNQNLTSAPLPDSAKVQGPDMMVVPKDNYLELLKLISNAKNDLETEQTDKKDTVKINLLKSQIDQISGILDKCNKSANDIKGNDLSAAKLNIIEFDYIFTGDSRGTLVQWNSKDNTVIKTYKNLHDSSINKLIKTRDGKFLFSIDVNGNMKQISVKEQKIVHDYDKILTSDPDYVCESYIESEVTYNDKFLYLGYFKIGNNFKGYVLQTIDIQSKKIVQTSENNTAIDSLAVTYDNKYIFHGDSSGNLFKYSSENHSLIGTFYKVHTNGIKYMFTTPENIYLYICDSHLNIKKFSLEDDLISEVYKYQNNIDKEASYLSIQWFEFRPELNMQFIFDNYSCLKEFGLNENKILKNTTITGLKRSSFGKNLYPYCMSSDCKFIYYKSEVSFKGYCLKNYKPGIEFENKHRARSMTVIIA